MTVPFQQIDVKTDYIKFNGGLDLETPVLSIDPGACLDAMNYQPGLFGGYERIDGFERFDGRANPSDALYYYATVTFAASVLVGQSVSGVTSGASGVVAYVDSTSIVLTKVSGTFINGETITRGNGGLPLLLTMTYAATTIGTFTSTPTLRGYSDALNDAIALNAAADIYRGDVDKPPGSGSILGGNLYEGVNYVFRNNAAGTAAQLWKQTSTGWSLITLGETITFTDGNSSVGDGDTLTQGSATATIARVVQTNESITDLEGRLILTSRTGNFYAGAATTTGGGTLTLGGASSQLSLLPSGRYECQNFNFSGSTDTYKMYFADGVNPAGEFDGTTYVPILTGMVTDTPKFLRCGKNKLHLSFRGSSQCSGEGLPYVWDVTVGAAEIGLGDDITGYAVLPGDAMAITARNSMHQLNGSTVDDYVLKNVSFDRGAIPYTVQSMGSAYCLDDQGIVSITPTQNYGNFSEGVISRKVQTLIDRLRPNIIASVVYRHRNQYRIYGDDGTGIILSMGIDKRGNPVPQFTEFDYNSGRTSDLINVTCVWAGEDSTGKDVVFFGADNGYVYQCEKGTSFDGNDIEAYLRMPFNNAKSPRLKKHYRKVVMEMESTGYTALRFHPEADYGNPVIATHQLQTQEIQGAGAYWGSLSAIWSQFFYDAQTVQTPEFKINISGMNLSLLFYSKSDYNASHVLQGSIVHFTPRKLVR